MSADEQQKSGPRLLFFLLVGFAAIIFLNLVVVSYPLYILLPLLKALFLVLVNGIYGFVLMAVFRQTRDSRDGQEEGIHWAWAFGVGLMVTTLFFFLLGVFQWLVVPLILAYFVMPLPLLWWIRKKYKHRFIKTLRGFLHRPALEYLVFLFPLLYVSLPITHYDTLAYYLGFPNWVLQNSGFSTTSFLFYPGAWGYSEILYIPAVFAGDLVPQLFNWFIAVIFILLAMDFARDYFKITSRTILLMTLVSLPMTQFLSTTISPSLIGAFFIFSGIDCFIKGKKKWSSLFWGFAVGIQYTNILPLGLFLFFHIVVALKEKRFLVFFKEILYFILIFAALWVPILVYHFLLSGNPVFVAAIGSENIGEAIGGGLLFLFFLPLLLFKKKEHPGEFFLLYLALATMVLGFAILPRWQVWYIAFILLSFYVVLAYQSLGSRVRSFFTLLFVMVVVVNVLVTYGRLETQYRAHELYLGKVSSDEYRSQNFPAYKAIRFVNNTTPAETRILLVGEARGYDLKRPHWISTGADHGILKKYLHRSRSPHAFAAILKQEGIGYVIFESNGFLSVPKSNNPLTALEGQQVLFFLNRLPVLFQEGGVFVFAVN